MSFGKGTTGCTFPNGCNIIYTCKLVPKCQSVNHNKCRCTHSWEPKKYVFFPALLSPWFFPKFPSGILSAPGGWLFSLKLGGMGKKLNKLDCPTKILGKDKRNNHTKTGWWFQIFCIFTYLGKMNPF